MGMLITWIIIGADNTVTSGDCGMEGPNLKGLRNTNKT